jgi:hypothetical protein
MKPIILLSTNNGYFKTPTDTVLGPMIMGWTYRDTNKNNYVIEPEHTKIIQVFPDGSSWVWIFKEKKYECVK